MLGQGTIQHSSANFACCKLTLLETIKNFHKKNFLQDAQQPFNFHKIVMPFLQYFPILSANNSTFRDGLNYRITALCCNQANYEQIWLNS